MEVLCNFMTGKLRSARFCSSNIVQARTEMWWWLPDQASLHWNMFVSCGDHGTVPGGQV